MKSRLQNSLVFRLTFIYSVTFTILACIVFGILYLRIQNTALEKLDQELMEDVESFKAARADLGIKVAVDHLEKEIGTRNPEEEFYRILTMEGKILASSDTSPWTVDDLKEDAGIFTDLPPVRYDYATIKNDVG